MKPLVSISHVCGGYTARTIVRDISVQFNAGDFFGLLGPNGSGKTTLLRLATRILKPSSGTITFRGGDISAMDIKHFCRSVAFVSQEVNPYFPYSVREFVSMGRIPHTGRLAAETKKDRAIVTAVLEATETAPIAGKLLDEISAGERQRVLIAQALAQEPALVFLDEPTSHLDIGHQIRVMDLLKRLNNTEGLTIVMVVHDLNLAADYCSRIALLDNGTIFKEGAPSDVLTYKHIEAVYKTVVLVHDNPVTHRPHVLLVPGEK